MNGFKNYYNILEISPFSNTEEIKKAYKNKMKIWHPDINKSPNSHEKSVEIQEAFQVLSSLEKRALYDNFYFNFYLQKQSSSIDLDKPETIILTEVIQNARNQAILFVNKGYKHFMKVIHQGVSFINYIFFIFSIFWISSIGIGIGFTIAYQTINAFIENKKNLKPIPVFFLLIFLSLSILIIYKTIKFAIYKLKYGPDSK
ncbi:J domain-containing protein [Algoriphagus aquatilis]|uniref:J domain-containing protein n=1 Tax=Algoriphagus aquatilis TaxID=490186 RepID=A0ABW0BYL5_9BACT